MNTSFQYIPSRTPASICPATQKTQLACFLKYQTGASPLKCDVIQHLFWSDRWILPQIIITKLPPDPDGSIKQLPSPNKSYIHDDVSTHLKWCTSPVLKKWPLEIYHLRPQITQDFSLMTSESPHNKPYPITLSDWGVQSPQQRYIRCHYYSQTVMGSRGKVHFIRIPY